MPSYIKHATFSEFFLSSLKKFRAIHKNIDSPKHVQLNFKLSNGRNNAHDDVLPAVFVNVSIDNTMAVN